MFICCLLSLSEVQNFLNDFRIKSLYSKRMCHTRNTIWGGVGGITLLQEMQSAYSKPHRLAGFFFLSTKYSNIQKSKQTKNSQKRKKKT